MSSGVAFLRAAGGAAAAFAGRALDLLYPRPCAGCGGAAGEGGHHLCGPCLEGLDVVHRPFCERCGDPADGVTGIEYACSSCRAAAPHFDCARSAVRFRGAVREAIHRFKYSGEVHLGADLAMLLGICVRTHYRIEEIDMLAYVPLFHTRERERGYNQARELAGALGRAEGLPVFRHLVRDRATGSQTRLNVLQRRENVSGAFRVIEPDWAAARTFLLVDDVMTTGATVNECARVLKQAGAHRVWVATVARG